ncbi:MAG: mechanosensitive ion channel family protein [Syntrophales bacterium]|jgi:small-conductance mechanosensitive channel|nr:mechanosensitive ion channel family protein [Syntrophales bacterium]
MNDMLTFLKPIAIALAYIGGGLVLGYIFEKIVLKGLRRIVSLTSWQADNIVVNSITGMMTLWFLLGGIYGAVLHLHVARATLDVVHKGLLVVFIFSFTIVLARIAADLVSLYSRQIGGVFLSTSIFANITRVVVYVIGILVILQSLGISIAPILTALGVGGLAVALALQDTLSNLFAGIHVIASGQLKPGDYVRMDSGEEGYVTDISWRYSTIRALPNNMIIVPNAKLASAIVTNYHMPNKEIGISLPVSVGYGSNLALVEKVTIEVAKEVMAEVQGGIPQFEPFVRYGKFADSGIEFNVIMRAKEFVDQYALRHEMIKRLLVRYRQEGIDIPYPIRTVYVKKDDPGAA